MSTTLHRLLAALVLLAANCAAHAQVELLTDREAFEARAGTTAIADFEQLRLGARDRLISAGMSLQPVEQVGGFSTLPRQVDLLAELVGLKAGFWFGDEVKGEHFVLTNGHSLRLEFPVDQAAFAFSASCFGCDNPELPGSWVIELFDREGRPVGQIDQVEALSVHGSFVGVLSPQAFRSAQLTRRATGNWMIDDIRQSAVQRLLLTDDSAEFESIAGSTGLVNFEEQPLGTQPVVQAGGVRLTQPGDPQQSEGLSLLDQLVLLPASYWFGDATSGSRFLLVNGRSLMLGFAADQIGFALLAACFACDTPEQPSVWTIELYDEAGELVIYQQQTRAMSVHGGYYGLISPRRFRHAVLTRSNGGNWLIDDLRLSALHRAPVRGGDSR